MMRDRTINMEARGLILFSLLVVQAYSAPNGCIEFCTGQQNVGSSYESSSSYRSHSKVVQGANVQDVNHLNYENRRPGNWTEHNEYVTDGGHGRVYEEKGQYVEGPKKVSYYRKNYSSSQTTGDLGGVDVLNRVAQVPSATHAVDQEYEYDRQRHRQQIRVHPVQVQVVQPVSQSISHDRRHDEYSQQQTSQTIQHGEIGSHIVQGQNQQLGVRPEDNWRVVDSHRTDGGHGQVYEEHGQYVNGPSKVRYYRRNYTASYGTPGNTVVSHQVPVTEDLQRHAEDLQRQYEELRRRTEHVTSVHNVPTPVQNIDILQTGHHQQQVESVVNNRVVPQPHVVTDEHSAEERYQKTSSRRVYGQAPVHTDGRTQEVVDRLVVQPQVYPSQNVYRNEHRSTVIEGQYQPVVAQPIIYVPSDLEQNVLTSTSHVGDRHVSHTNLDSSSVSGINTHSVLGQNVGSTSELYQHQSGRGINSNSHLGQLVHGQHTLVYPAATTTGHVQQYEEHWKSSGHVKGTTIPQNQILSQSTLQNSGYGNEMRWVPSGQLTTGAIDLGQVSTHSVDCTNEAAEHVSRYHRLYKRNVKTGRRRVPVGDYFHDYRHRPVVPAAEGQQTEEYTGYRRDEKPEETQQQTSGFGGYSKPDYDYTQHPGRVPIRERQPVDFTQQNEDLQQHTGGFEDFAHGKPKDNEFGRQKWHNHGTVPAAHQEPEDFGQHSSGFEQQTGGFNDFSQQPSANLEFGQHTQKQEELQTSNQHLEHFGQHSDDLEQHTGGFDDFTQQPSANLEFGQHVQKPHKPSQEPEGLHTRPKGNQHLEDFGQHSDDLEQHTGGFDDFTQQPVANLEFGQHTQKPKEHHDDFTQQTEDLQQHTGGSDDFTQQTSGNLEFGQETQKPENLHTRPTSNQHLEDFGQHSDDLEQHTGSFDDFSQQTSGNLEFGQHVTKPQKPKEHHDDFTQQNEDLQQHTGGFDDFTQQTSANLEFGQHTQKPQDLETAASHQHTEGFGQHSDDLQQHTGGFDDFSQQTSGNLEFGQSNQKPHKLQTPTGNQHLEEFGQHDEHLEQHTGGFDDFSQQTSGNLEFGQSNQKPHKLQTPTGNQHLEEFGQHDEHLEQQTGGFDDFTQQTSGNLELGQHTQKPQKPGQGPHGNQHSNDFTQQNEDLQQHTGGFDDFTQQTSGNLEFGQHTQKPQKPGQVPHDNQHPNDFTQQNEDLQQHTGGFGDFTQQTSGNLEFGQHTQKPQKPGQVPHDNQHPNDFTQQNEDLQQHTGGFDDFTQQTSGNLEFGQHTQKPQKPGQVPHDNQHPNDFTQQNEDLQQHTGGFDDFTQQTSGNLEFGQHTQQPDQIPHDNQHLNQFTQQNEDLHQHTGGFDDFTQQTSGNLEIGQQTWKPSRVPSSNQQQTEDLQQHTGGFDDFTQQQSGNLEFGQLTWKPATVPSSNQEQTEDLQQHTGGFDDFTQQQSGNLEFEQQTQQSGQHHDDFTQQNQDFQQQTGGFDDFSQHPSANLEFGHQETETEKPVVCQSSICRKPAPKPTPKVRPGRGSRYGLETLRTPAPVQQQENTWQPHTEGAQQNPNEPIMEQATAHDVRGENFRADQLIVSTTQKATAKTDENIHHIGDEQVVQQTDDWGAEWHQRHKPSDLTSEYTQQQSRVPDFTSQSQTHFNQDDRFSQQQQATIEQISVDQKPFDHYQQSQVKGQKINQGWEQQTDGVEIKTEPRILEAYGGSGPYDPTHDDNIFSRVPLNPSATLPPHVDKESWIVREKPAQDLSYMELHPTTTPEPTTTTTETAPPSFWGRVGHKLTSTFDKAKEKAKEVFG